MTRKLIPPRGIFIPSSILYNDEIDGNVLVTWVRLRGLAWGLTMTQWMTAQELALVCKKSKTTLYGHLAILRDRGALRWRSAQDGTLRVSFPEEGSFFVPEDSGFPDSSDQEEEEEDEDSINKSLLLPPPPDQAPKTSRSPENRSGRAVKESAESTRAPRTRAKRAAQTAEKSTQSPKTDRTRTKQARRSKKTKELDALPETLADALADAGVFRSLFAEIADSGLEEADLLALLAWAQVDAPETPGGLFMGRLRAGARAPARFYEEACPWCGQYGKHAPGCYRGYAEWEE